ncbi:MAG: glycosyltransferase [Rickettsiaceae bacterium]|jgi:glycosyltransferase involved in cell wall biosynthesis|nr:glycosyltransferase [Rickettsiaceae bacterium]
MRLPISAFIITKNEELNIARAINSIKNIVDDLYVIDSGSQDKTVEIAESLGAKVIYNEWPGYTKQKAFGESLCKHKWILNIDADEELSKELQNEIEYIFVSKQQDKYKAYEIDRVIIHRNEDRLKSFAPSDIMIRLYNIDYASYASNNSSTHDSVVLKPGVNKEKDVYLFNGAAYHRSGTSIEQLVAKANFYSSEQAKDMLEKGRFPSKIRVVGEFFFWLFKAFFIRRYFVFGFSGFVDSMIFAFARFLRMAKAREKFLQERKKQP